MHFLWKVTIGLPVFADYFTHQAQCCSFTPECKIKEKEKVKVCQSIEASVRATTAAAAINTRVPGADMAFEKQ